MAYSIVGILAIAIHLLVNIDVFIHIGKKKRFIGERYYLFFLLSVIAYHITDGFWGFLYDAKLATAVTIDTSIYFIAMASSILLWGLFVNRYLESKYSKIITYAVLMVFSIQIVLIFINFFYPILFQVSEDCVYSALPARYAMLTLQVLMYIALSIYAFVASRTKEGSLERRYLTIGLFGVFMTVAITLQVFFPLLPMYSLGFLLGITALHAFVVEDEISNQKVELEKAKYESITDALTETKNKHAYVDRESEIDKLISDGKMNNFAVIVFDLNDLKSINDLLGHDAGDKYIIDSAKLIASVYKDVPIYRVGGDEFTIILENENYDNREALLDEFNQLIDENVNIMGSIIIAAGSSDYVPKIDTSILQVFTRADREMYKRKYSLKSKLLSVTKNKNQA